MLLVLSIPAHAQRELRKDGLIADANHYRKVISSKHINPFTKISKPAFNQKIDSLILLLPAMDQSHFTVELMKINALIGDEHTILFPDDRLVIPFKFRWFDEGMTIVAADSANKKYLLYRVLAIDGVSWDTIDSLYRNLIKQDNPSYFSFFETYYFNNAEILYGLDIIRQLSSIKFQLLSLDNDTINATIIPAEKNNVTNWNYAAQYETLLAHAAQSNYWFRMDTESSILYFNYQHCSENEEEPFSVFNQKMFDTIEKLKPEKIVLDLRMNSGGNSGVLQPFIDRIRKSELNTKERFFVVIGRTVMSSALMNAVELKKTTNATFVGEPTGGNINHFGEIKSFVLPYSNIRITYSTKYHETWKNHDGPLLPDVVTSNKLADFSRSYDSALEIIKSR